MLPRAAMVVVSLCLAFPTSGHAWWVKGHGAITEAAVSRLPSGVPAFFRGAGKELNYLAGEPDRWKNPELKFIRAGEAPEHYVDLEDYEGNDLPGDRYQAIALLTRLKRRPERAGMLPYAILEYFERLCIAFRDLRDLESRERSLGENPSKADRETLAAQRKAIEMKCLTYAGVLSHYAGDLCMPLHVTIDYDGRVKEKGPDGKKRQQGIHAKIDAFPERNGFTPEELARPVETRAIDDVWQLVVATIKESYAVIDRCYELDLAGAFDKPTAESRSFIMDRCRAATQLTSDLFYTAWLRSATVPPSY